MTGSATDGADLVQEFHDLTGPPPEEVTEEEVKEWVEFVKGLQLGRWYRQHEGKRSGKMPEFVCLILVFYFTFWKYATWTAMIVASDKSLQDNYYQTPHPVSVNASCCPQNVVTWVCDAEWHTPFQQHPQQFGEGFQVMVTSHMISAFCLFALVFIPISLQHGSPMHILFGRLFVGVWVWHMTGGLIAAIVVLLERGYQPELYPVWIPDMCADSQGRPGFSLWLYVQFAFIAQCVMDFLIHALVAIQYKEKVPRWLKWIMIVGNSLTILHGLGYVILAFVILTTAINGTLDTFDLGEFNGAAEYGVVFLVQCPAYMVLLILNIRYLAHTEDERRHMWTFEHRRTMIFAMNLTVITFMANVTFRVAGLGAPQCECPATPPSWSLSCTTDSLTRPIDGGSAYCANQQWSCATNCKGGFPDLTAIAWASSELLAFTYWIVGAKIMRNQTLAAVTSSSIVRGLAGKRADGAAKRAKAEVQRLERVDALYRAAHKDTPEAKELSQALEVLRGALQPGHIDDFAKPRTHEWGELLCCCGSRRTQVDLHDVFQQDGHSAWVLKLAVVKARKHVANNVLGNALKDVTDLFPADTDAARAVTNITNRARAGAAGAVAAVHAATTDATSAAVSAVSPLAGAGVAAGAGAGSAAADDSKTDEETKDETLDAVDEPAGGIGADDGIELATRDATLPGAASDEPMHIAAADE